MSDDGNDPNRHNRNDPYRGFAGSGALSALLIFLVILFIGNLGGSSRISMSFILLIGGIFAIHFFVRSSARNAKARSDADEGDSAQGTRIFRSTWLEIREFGQGGDLTGNVLDGNFAGRTLGKLSDRELIVLLDQFGREDRFTEKALRAWIAHARPHLEEATAVPHVSNVPPVPKSPVSRPQAGQSQAPQPEAPAQEGQRWRPASTTQAGTLARNAPVPERTRDVAPVRIQGPESLEGMTRGQAYSVLGILETNDPARIRNAYERAVKLAGGASGGSTKTLARIKLAQRVLLGE